VGKLHQEVKLVAPFQLFLRHFRNIRSGIAGIKHVGACGIEISTMSAVG
jgi:hypothetical protein